MRSRGASARRCLAALGAALLAAASAGVWPLPPLRQAFALAGRRPPPAARSAGRAERPRSARTRSLAAGEYRGDPYFALGLERDATREDIKKAFRERIRTAHPDAGGSAEEFQQVQAAYKAALKLLARQRGGEGRPAPRGPAGSETWSIKDFYKWRREQVQKEREDWERDSEFQGARARHFWPGSEQRYREQKAKRDEKRREEQELDNEFRDALRREKAQRPQQRATRRRSSGVSDTDLFGDWAEVLRDKPKGRKASADPGERAPRQQRQRGKDPVVSHRVMSTAKGPIRVPIYESASGSRYYHSPLTSAKVNVPN